MQISKKDLLKKKYRIGVIAHREGKFICNCLIKNYRKWLGQKKYGKQYQKSDDDQDR